MKAKMTAKKKKSGGLHHKRQWENPKTCRNLSAVARKMQTFLELLRPFKTWPELHKTCTNDADAPTTTRLAKRNRRNGVYDPSPTGS